MTQSDKFCFRGHLSSAFPSQVIIDVSEICNYACIHCPHPDMKASMQLKNRLLPIELHHKLVDEIAEHGRGHTRYIRYTAQGEPLTHPELRDMIRYARSKLECAINLTTNGSVLRGQRLEDFADSGVTVFDISLDAFEDDTYAKVRVNGNLPRVRENIRGLLRKREEGGEFKLVVSFVEQELNRGEAEDFRRFWTAEGADRVVVRQQHSCAGAKDELLHLSGVPDDPGRTPCLYPWERISLGPTGHLHFCAQDWVGGSTVADYRTSTVHELWQGEFYQRLREAHLTNDYSQHAFCGKCPDWGVAQWPHDKGRSYGEMMIGLVEAGDDAKE